MDVLGWLRNLGLEQYEAIFRDNDIDAPLLSSLTNEDLKDIGVASLGHRRKLLEAIAVLRPGQTGAAVGPTLVSGAEAERRQLTLMFCDLVGSTPLASRFDPEDLSEIIGSYHRTVTEAIARFDGFVAKFMGDGVLTYFGYPKAHEDDAERVVRAGLAVIDAVARLDLPERLAVRIGVATGLVVVGDLIGQGAAQERGVVGETPNLTARLQALAAPNDLVIADATRRQLGALFEIEDLGTHQLAGFAEPQHAWRVVAESGVVSRFEALRSRATPLVGREAELDQLLAAWWQAKTGEGRVVLVSGEPGIGKSRLLAEVVERLEPEPHTRLRYFCSPHHQHSALYPFISQLERAADFARDDIAEQKRAKLNALLGPAAESADEIELIAELLSLPNSAAALNFTPQRKRQLLLESLVHQLEGLVRGRPVLMVFEDGHWSDATSRELLGLTIDHVKGLPIALFITFRPEFEPPWGYRPYISALTLNRLSGSEGATLVENLAGNRGLSRDVIGEIVDHTDGVPLFVEELTKAVLESADQLASVLAASSASSLGIPATLHASLISRLDRLGTAAKEVAQIGAVLGREFSHELIHHVARRPDLDTALGQLTNAGLLFCRGLPPQSSYLFKHALVQDAAYGTLLRRRRQQLHGRTAAALGQEFADLVERQPELLAHHLTGAGDAERAGDRADDRSARGTARSRRIARGGYRAAFGAPRRQGPDRAHGLRRYARRGGAAVARRRPRRRSHRNGRLRSFPRARSPAGRHDAFGAAQHDRARPDVALNWPACPLARWHHQQLSWPDLIGKARCSHPPILQTDSQTGQGRPCAGHPPTGHQAEAGADFVLLDTEHSGVGIETIKMQIAASRGLGIVPMVRVPGCHYHLIAPVLDAGDQEAAIRICPSSR